VRLLVATALVFSLASVAPPSRAADPGWTLQATFGRLRVVLVERRHGANEALYRQAARSLCAEEPFCDVMFWDDPAKVPRKLPASNETFAAQTAEWRQNLQTGHRELLIACRLVQGKRPCLPRH
jgi:hypothetical protein